MYYQFNCNKPLRVVVHQVHQSLPCLHTYDFFYQFEKDLESWLILKDFDAKKRKGNTLQFFVNKQLYLELTFLGIGLFESLSAFYLAWDEYREGMSRMRHKKTHSGKKTKKRKVKDHKFKQAKQAGIPDKLQGESLARIKIRPCPRFSRKHDYR